MSDSADNLLQQPGGVGSPGGESTSPQETGIRSTCEGSRSVLLHESPHIKSSCSLDTQRPRQHIVSLFGTSAEPPDPNSNTMH